MSEETRRRGQVVLGQVMTCIAAIALGMGVVQHVSTWLTARELLPLALILSLLVARAAIRIGGMARARRGRVRRIAWARNSGESRLA